MVRRALSTMTTVLVATAIAVPGAAQEREGAREGMESAAGTQQAEQGPYLLVTHYQVPPAQAERFVEGAELVREAARQADLDPEEHGWSIWRQGDDFYLTEVRDDLSTVEDPGRFMRQFEGTPGEQTLERAFGSFEGVDLEAESYIGRLRPEWAYVPEQPAVQGEPGGAFVIREWVRVGVEEELGQSQQRLVNLLREISFPYEVQAYQTVVGDLGRLEIVIFFDDLARFYGENSLQTLLEAAGRAEAWGETMQERDRLIRKVETFPVFYVSELSYPAAGEAGEAEEDDEAEGGDGR